jgi:hypothetical protein
MTGSFSRKLYRQILLLYPGPFRQEFGDEMLSMFDECSSAQGSWHVLANVLLSAAKQQAAYLSIPAPKSAPSYSDIASPPNLPRILALAVSGAVLIASVMAGGGKPKARESWTTPCARSRSIATQTTMQLIHFNSGDLAHHE